MSSPATNSTTAGPNGGASGASLSPALAMMMAASAASKETVRVMLAVQASLIGLAFLIAIPLIYVSIRSGRFKTGVWLKVSKKSDDHNRPLSLILKGNPVRKNHPPSQPLFVHFKRAYNCVILRTIPFINLTVGQIFILLIFLGIALFGLLYKNLAAPASNFKRPGWIAVSSLPLLFLLAMKNTPFAILGKGYERVNFLHRFVGRIIIIAAFAHGGLWLRSHLKMNQPIVFKGTPLTGLIALCTFAMVLLSSIKLFRSRFYQTFLILHVLGYITVLVALWFHKATLRPFIAFAIAAIISDALQGMALKTHIRSAVLTTSPGGLTKIQVTGLGDGWRAGQHVYLRVMKGFRRFEKHPFTIANAPSSMSPVDHHQGLVLVAKAAGDFTKSIYLLGHENNLVHPNFSEAKQDQYEKGISPSTESIEQTTSVHVAVEGPYGSFYTDMSRHETVVLVAGGSGFTYCSATLEDIVGTFIRGNSMTAKVYVVWALRDLSMTHVFAPPINETIRIAREAGLDVTFRIHMSSSTALAAGCPIVHSELVPLRLDASDLISEALQYTVSAITSRNDSRGSGVGVGVCGPTPLISSVRGAVSGCNASLASKAGGISLHSEIFGW